MGYKYLVCIYLAPMHFEDVILHYVSVVVKVVGWESGGNFHELCCDLRRAERSYFFVYSLALRLQEAASTARTRKQPVRHTLSLGAEFLLVGPMRFPAFRKRNNRSAFRFRILVSQGRAISADCRRIA